MRHAGDDEVLAVQAVEGGEAAAADGGVDGILEGGIG